MKPQDCHWRIVCVMGRVDYWHGEHEKIGTKKNDPVWPVDDARTTILSFFFRDPRLWTLLVLFIGQVRARDSRVFLLDRHCSNPFDIMSLSPFRSGVTSSSVNTVSSPSVPRNYSSRAKNQPFTKLWASSHDDLSHIVEFRWPLYSLLTHRAVPRSHIPTPHWIVHTVALNSASKDRRR